MKRKWLIGLLSILMALAMCFGFAACGGDEGGGTEQGGQQGSGTQTDQEIADAAIASLKTLVKDGETPSAYSVLGQTKVNGTMYDIVWTVTSTDVTNIGDYVQIGTMDASTKQITIGIVKGVAPIAYKLKATVTVNSASASMEVTKTIPAKPKDAAGTLDDPYSPSKVIEIASTLGTAGTYYYSDADKGNEVPTVVWVEGYIVNCGNGTQFGSAAVGWVYIADEYDANKTYNNTNSLCVYRIEYDEENLTSFDDLALGKKIKLHGHIEWYQGKNDSAPYAELASFKKSDNTYSDIYCDYLEKEERTPAQKIELALSKVNATMTVTAANDVELPVSTVKDVTFEWSTTDTTYTVSDNKLHVSSLPTDEDKQITITVKATCGTENDTKDVTVTIKKAAEVVAGSEVYDFSGLTGQGTGLTDTNALDTIKGACSGNSKLDSVTVKNIYNGNATGGAYPNTAGLLKFGKSGDGNDGTLTLTFSENVSKIVINCHDWNKKSSQPTNSNTISVNDATAKTLPYNETGAGGDVEFVLAAPSKTVKIVISQRGFVFNFTITFAEGGSTTPGGDSENEGFNPITSAPTKAGEYLIGMEVSGTWYYLTGAAGSKEYYLAVSNDVTKAATFTVEPEGDGFVIKYGAKYLEIIDNGGYVNSLYRDSRTAACVWKWNSQYNTLTVEITGTTNNKDGTYFLGSYSTYTSNMSASNVTNLTQENEYPSRLGTYKAPAGGGTTDPADTDVLYSLNSDEQVSGSSNAYAGNCDVECNGVTWNVEGNSQQQPWRFGGKSITGTDRKLTGKTAITGTVAKITLQLTDSGSITTNSVTLKVYSSDPTADGAVAIATKNIEYQKDTEITITPDAGSEWTDCYYQIIFNVTVGSSNKYVSILKLEFSKAPAAAAASVETPVAILPGDEH